jgi:hypothetical protein
VNNTAEEKEAKVSLNMTNVVLQGQNTKTVTLPANGSKLVYFDIEV